MEILATKIAELLDVTIEQAIILYPILRTQFIWYNILKTISWVFVPPAIALSVFSVFSIGEYSELKTRINNRLYKDEHDALELKLIKSMSTKYTSFAVIFILALVVINICLYVVSPDLMMIMKFLR